MSKFNASTVSDQKRLARGEQWLFARSFLRAWYHTHNSDYRVMMLAGGSPEGEIRAIRELLPHAQITAVDKDQACVDLARSAGANDGICCDLTDWTFNAGIASKRPADALAVKFFEVVNLDLCGGASENMRDMLHVYRGLVCRPGLLMFTFSYGRDVVEFFKMRQEVPEHLIASGIPQTIAARLAYVAGSAVYKIVSVVLYSGNEMPMCSAVIECPRKGGGQKGRGGQRKVSFVKLMDGDFELSVLHPDVRLLYDCPQDRIEQLRRSHAANKAVATRRAMLGR